MTRGHFSGANYSEDDLKQHYRNDALGCFGERAGVRAALGDGAVLGDLRISDGKPRVDVSVHLHPSSFAHYRAPLAELE